MSASEQQCRERSAAYAEESSEDTPEKELREPLPEGLLAFDRDWRYTYVNRAAEEMLGWSRDALLGRPVWEIDPSLVETPLYEAYMRAVAEQVPVVVETTCRQTGRQFEFRALPSPDSLHVHVRLLSVPEQDSCGCDHPEAVAPMAQRQILIEKNAELIARFDPQGRHLYAVPIAPYPSSLITVDYVGKTNEELRIPEAECDRERWTDTLRQVLETAKSASLLLEDAPGVGDRRSRLIRFVPERCAGGCVLSVIAIVQDITERLRAEGVQRQSAERYGALAHVTANIVWICDRDGRCLEPSPTWESFTGRAAASIEGRGYLDVIHGDDREEAERAWNAALSAGIPSQFEHRVRRRDGLWRTVLTRVAPLRDPDTGAVREWVCASTDVTERRAIEAALRASEERYAAISSMTSDYAFAYRLERDGSLRLEWITDAFTEISGYTAEELDGMGWDALLHRDDAAHAEETARRTLVYGDEVTLEARMRTRCGEIRWLRIYLRPRYGHGGAIVGFYGAAQDITEQKRAEAELRAAHQKQRRIAETLQDSLLITPPEDGFPGLEIHTRYAAAWDEAAVGGDFHDAFLVETGRVALVVGDVMGKGLAAAACTAEIKFALRALLREHRHPGAALERLNDYILVSQQLNPAPESALVSIVLAVVDTATGELEVATAGAEPPLLLRRSDMHAAGSETPPGAPMLGIGAEFTYPLSIDRLDEGDLLLLFTDGLTEARRGGKGTRFFGAAGVAAAARLAAAAGTADEGAGTPAALSRIGAAILGAVREFAQRDRLDDDLCLMLVRRSGRPSA